MKRQTDRQADGRDMVADMRFLSKKGIPSDLLLMYLTPNPL